MSASTQSLSRAGAPSPSTRGPGATAPGRVSPARRAAFAVLRRVFDEGAYADRTLHAEAAELDPRDRALAMRLAFGAVQRRATLDHVIEALTARATEQLDAPILAALRLGLYELLYTDRVSPYATVNEAVELAKAGGRGGERLVNAVLRKAAAAGARLLDTLDDSTPGGAALAHSLPTWLAQMWWDAFGASEARALMGRINEPAESALRANALVSSASELLEALPIPARPDPQLPEAVILDAPFDAHGSLLWQQGSFTPQSRASMLVARAVDPRPGERILDLCAAPGAKTTHLAALTGDRAHIMAVERHPGRAEALRDTCRRMRAESVTVEVADAGVPRDADDLFDRVLVDPPCSGLGTLQSRPDLRWRVSPETVRGVQAEQRRILEAAAAAVRPGGMLVYSTCTLSPAENERQLERFLDSHREFVPLPITPAPTEPGREENGLDMRPWQHPSLPGALLISPHRHGTDGFFIARMRRNDLFEPGR